MSGELDPSTEESFRICDIASKLEEEKGKNINKYDKACDLTYKSKVIDPYSANLTRVEEHKMTESPYPICLDSFEIEHDESWESLSSFRIGSIKTEHVNTEEVKCQSWRWDWNSFKELASNRSLYESEMFDGQDQLSAEFANFGAKDVLFTALLISCCCLYFSALYVAQNFVEQSYDVIDDTSSESKWLNGLKQLEFFLHELVFVPFFWIFSVYVATNLITAKGWKLWIILLVMCLSLQCWWGLGVFTLRMIQTYTQIPPEKLVFWHVPLSFFFDFLLYVFLCSMVKFLGREWYLDNKWLPFNWICFYAIYFITTLPYYLDNETVKDIVVWIPLLTCGVEYFTRVGLRRTFNKYKENEVCLAWHTLCLLSYPEILRFVSFVMVCLLYLSGGPLGHVVWNILLSIMGEIWVHTQISKLVCYQIKSKICGKRYDNFLELDGFVNAIRCHLEYLVPVWVFAFLLVNESFLGTSKFYGKLMKNMTFILGLYYIQESIAEFLCWGIRKLSPYPRASAVGNFSWTVSLMMAIATFFNYQIFSAVWFLEIVVDG